MDAVAISVSCGDDNEVHHRVKRQAGGDVSKFPDFNFNVFVAVKVEEKQGKHLSS